MPVSLKVITLEDIPWIPTIPLVTELGRVNVWLILAMTTCILILPISPEVGGLENASVIDPFVVTV